MANENETVEQVCEKMKEPSIYKGRFPASFFDGEFREFAERILAAHNREIADFQRRYDECVRRFNEADVERVRLRDEVAAKDAKLDRCKLEYIRCREELRATRERRDDCEVKMRKALERVTRAENALAGKDAEIASLHETIKRLEHENSVFFIDIDALRALVKELADVAERFVSCKATECETVCGVGAKCIHKKAIALIAKAREVSNG